MSRKLISIKHLVCCIAIFCFVCTEGYSQTIIQPGGDTTKQSTSILAWLKDIYEQGVSMQGDSVVISKEAERLLADEQYRKAMYPATYTWEAARDLVQKQEIKKALWYFINLYSVNSQKELVIKSLLAYDKFLKMDKALMGSFYTYCFTDPEIGKIENGHSEITAPHIMEKKLNALKEMLYYLDKYKPKDRKEDSAGK